MNPGQNPTGQNPTRFCPYYDTIIINQSKCKRTKLFIFSLHLKKENIITNSICEGCFNKNIANNYNNISNKIIN